MIESQYTSAIHKKLPKNIYKWKINDNFAGGVPDAFYRSLAARGRPLWVEYKFLKALPKRPTTVVKPDLSSQQLAWLKQAKNAGEQAYVIIGVENVRYKNQACGVVLDTIEEWENGIIAAEFLRRCEKSNYDTIAEIITNTCN